MRLAWSLTLCLWAAGCAAEGGRARTDRKELFVETAPVSSLAPRVVSFPLRPEVEPGLYVLVRSVERGDREAREKLGVLLEQWPPPPEEGGRDAPVTLDLSDYPPADPPVVLWTLGEVRARKEGGCYVGHGCFLGERRETDQGEAYEVVHHLRFYLANRGARAVALRADEVELETLGPPALPLPRLASADTEGRAADLVVVPPGGEGGLSVFFAAVALAPAVRLSWRVAEQVDGPRGRSVPFRAVLRRRYAIEEGRISALEDAVARRLPLPPAGRRERPEPWREPFMERAGE